MISQVTSTIGCSFLRLHPIAVLRRSVPLACPVSHGQVGLNDHYDLDHSDRAAALVMRRRASLRFWAEAALCCLGQLRRGGRMT